MNNKLRYEVEELGNQVRNQVDNQVWNQVSNQVWNQARNQVLDQVWWLSLESSY